MDRTFAIILAVIIGLFLLVVIINLIKIAIGESVKKAKKVGVVKTVADTCVGIGIVSALIFLIIGISESSTAARMPSSQQDNVYINENGSSPVHIPIYPDGSVDIVIYKGQSLEGNWSSEGFRLILDGYYDSYKNPLQITVAEPKKKIWGEIINTNLYDMLEPFSIGGNITLPNIETKIPSSISGTIKGTISYPTILKNQLFKNENAVISVPVIIDLISIDEKYIAIAEMEKKSNTACMVCWISIAFIIVSLIISYRFNPKRKEDKSPHSV